MSKTLAVFRGLPIPVDLAPIQTYAILAKRDGGKTYLTARFEEQLCDAGVFFVTLDPVGKHWSLRAGPDGSEKGGKRDVWVLGGLHGDVPLDPHSGELIADIVVDHPGRYILDVSTFETDAEQDRFATAFAKRLFRRKAQNPGFPLMLILEEAESFIPERPQPGQAPMLGAFGRIMRQGRNHGLGMWMVAQRAQALNKGVLSQAEVLIVKQMAHNRDQAAVDAWVKSNGTPEQRDTIMASLASLHVDEAWVWSPSWLRCFAQTKVLERATFDASRSVRHGDKMANVELVPLDVEALGQQMRQVADRAKASDPKELQRRVRELERELASRPTETETVEVEVERMPEFVLPRMIDVEGLARPLEKQASAIMEAIGTFRADLENFTPAAAAVHSGSAGKRGARPAAPTRPAGGDGARGRGSNGRSRAPSSPPAGGGNAVGAGSARAQPAPLNDDLHISRSQQAIIDALAWFESVGIPTPRRAPLAAIAGVSSKSSGFEKNLSTLRTNGLIDYPDGGRVELTSAGRDRAQQPDSPGTEDELHDAVCRMVSGPQATLLRELIAAYPDSLTREDLAERAGVSPVSSGFEKNLSRLRSYEVADYPTRGSVAALPILFFS